MAVMTEAEAELEARCAEYRVAKLALDRGVALEAILGGRSQGATGPRAGLSPPDQHVK